MACTAVDRPVSAQVPRGQRALRRLTLAAAEALSHPRAALTAARAVAGSGQQSWRDATAGTVQWLVVGRLVRRARRAAGLHLVEEGTLQTLWTLGLRARRAD